MFKDKKIIARIKELVNLSAPTATLILYGSHARGENKKGSDIDLLILLDHDNITDDETRQIKYPLYDLEFETGKIISPLILSKNDWETRHSVTPFYSNVKKDGIII